MEWLWVGLGVGASIVQLGEWLGKLGPPESRWKRVGLNLFLLGVIVFAVWQVEQNPASSTTSEMRH